MRDAAGTVCMEVLSLQVQCSNVRRTGSRLTGSFGDQHDPAVLGYLALKTLQRAGHARSTILIHLDAFAFPPPMLNIHFLSLADLKVFRSDPSKDWRGSLLLRLRGAGLGGGDGAGSFGLE